jgi:predicted transcriptional regulator
MKSDKMVNVKADPATRDQINEIADREGRKRYCVQDEAVRRGLAAMLTDLEKLEDSE